MARFRHRLPRRILRSLVSWPPKWTPRELWIIHRSIARFERNYRSDVVTVVLPPSDSAL